MRYGFYRVAAVLLIGAATLAGCSKSSSPTSPYGGGAGGGGGGGGGGTAFNSGALTAPTSFSHTFAATGSVGYHCNFHQSMGMVGTVNVVSGGAASATVTASGTTFSPSSVTIGPGGTVTWNVTGGTHTVTSN